MQQRPSRSVSGRPPCLLRVDFERTCLTLVDGGAEVVDGDFSVCVGGSGERLSDGGVWGAGNFDDVKVGQNRVVIDRDVEDALAMRGRVDGPAPTGRAVVGAPRPDVIQDDVVTIDLEAGCRSP